MPRLRDLIRRRAPLTVFVLSGGGNLGALQVGMLKALVEAGIEPDLVLGCSVGALNGAAIAADPSAAMISRLQELWLGLADDDVMPAGLFPVTVQMARRGVSIHQNTNLRRVVEEILTPRRFEDLAVPFECVAASLIEGREVWFSSGPLLEPILASAALPAVYPPVEVDGVKYIDGAVVNDVPVSRAVEKHATRIFVLHVGAWDRPRAEPKRPFDMAVYAYWLARRSRFQRDLASIPTDVEVVVLPPGATPLIRFNDLGHSDEMITAAYEASRAFLEARDGPGHDDLKAAVPTVRPDERPAPRPLPADDQVLDPIGGATERPEPPPRPPF